MRTSTWTIEKIKNGFDRFQETFGRLPTALEIDGLDYLPSSRYIQIKFGGLEKLRTKLGYKHAHFGKDSFRSAIANRVGRQGRRLELDVEKRLREKFGEVFVHTEKMFGPSKCRVDFYVYSPDGDFGIDVFHTENLRYLQSNINIKLKKYKDFPAQLFLVTDNEEFSQKDCDRYVNSKTIPMPQNVEVVTLETMLKRMRTKRAYPNPIHERFHGGNDSKKK